MAALMALVLILAACGDGDGDAGGTTTTAAGGGDGDGGVDMSEADFTVFGAPRAAEGDALQGFLDVYNEQKGSDINYEGSDDFENQLRIRVDGGNPPAVSFTPQPASICDFAEDGHLASLEEMGFDIAEMEENHGKFWMDLGLCEDGQHYGIPWFPNYKSIVWYNSEVFEQGGYEIPESYEDMVALSEQMVADGVTPWCFAFESGTATGWPGTDWLEDIVVREQGGEFYGQWFRHEVPFNSPEIVQAFDTFGEIFFGEGFVLGGPDGVAAINFQDAVVPLYEGSCAMHKQGSFFANFFENAGPDEEVSEVIQFFPFPEIDGQGGAMGGGDTLIVFDPQPEVVQAVKDWITPEWGCVLASPSGGTASEHGGHGVAGVERLPGHKDIPVECYESEAAKTLAAVVRDALANNTFVFDASDLMPPEVGQGSFWQGMVDWSRGKPTQEVVDDIEASWPTS